MEDLEHNISLLQDRLERAYKIRDGESLSDSSFEAAAGPARQSSVGSSNNSQLGGPSPKRRKLTAPLSAQGRAQTPLLDALDESEPESLGAGEESDEAFSLRRPRSARGKARPQKKARQSIQAHPSQQGRKVKLIGRHQQSGQQTPGNHLSFPSSERSFPFQPEPLRQSHSPHRTYSTSATSPATALSSRHGPHLPQSPARSPASATARRPGAHPPYDFHLPADGHQQCRKWRDELQRAFLQKPLEALVSF